jgi:general stress protein 26
MQKWQLLNKLQEILDDAGTGVLATSDSSGRTHMRWMTPVVSSHRAGAIFAFSVPGTPKIEQIEATGNAEWMIQRSDLTEIINLQGPTRVVDNPALKAELMDIVGNRLAAFWKANTGQDEFVLIETVIEQATYFKPMQGAKQTVEFS